MLEIQKPPRRFTMLMLSISIVLAAFIPVFSQLSTNISIISLLFGQLALVCLYTLASFPRADYELIGKLSLAYLAYIGTCFAVLGLMPMSPENKLFGWQNFPALIMVDIPSFILLNVSAFIYMSLGFTSPKTISAEQEPPKQNNSILEEAEKYQKQFQENLSQIFSKPEPEAPVTESILEVVKPVNIDNVKTELRDEVQNLFSDYLPEAPEAEGKLNHVEEVLVQNLAPVVEEALCMDEHGNILNNSVFRWQSTEPSELIELFDKHNLSSQQLSTGRLCQMLINSENHWYMIARYRNNFLALKTSAEEPEALLETTFNVFRSL